MTLANNIRRARTVAGLSQKDLAEKANVAQQLISQIERGVNDSTKFLPQIAAALGLPLGHLDPRFTAPSPVQAPGFSDQDMGTSTRT